VPSEVTAEYLSNLTEAINIRLISQKDLPSKQALTYRVLELSPSEMVISVEFKSPEYISFEEQDQIEIAFVDTSWIRSLNNDGLNYMLPNFNSPAI
jgi:hypothetical protein